jgi:hypothetical protein
VQGQSLLKYSPCNSLQTSEAAPGIPAHKLQSWIILIRWALRLAPRNWKSRTDPAVNQSPAVVNPDQECTVPAPIEIRHIETTLARAVPRGRKAGAMCVQLKIRDLELVVALHEERTFTQAARRIGMQTALSKRLQTIERIVQARLFDRTHDGATITDQGRLFVSGAAEIVHAFYRTV